MFSTPESGLISDRWTSVMIEGGESLDDEGRDFMERYGVGGYPSLLAVTASGALIDRDLMDGRMRKAEYLYSALEKAEDTNRRFLEVKERLIAAGDAESSQRLADLYVERQELEPAVQLYATAFAAAPTEDLVHKRLMLYARLGEREAEQALLDQVIEQFPDATERMGWRMRRATIHIAPPTSQAEEAANAALHVEALEGLRQELAADGDLEGEATARLAMGTLQRHLDQTAEYQANLDWVFEHAPQGRAARVAHLLIARYAHEMRETEKAREHAKAVLEMAPKSEEAAGAHMLLGDLAYGDHDLDAMEKHYQTVVELAPASGMADEARSALQFLQRRRERDGD